MQPRFEESTACARIYRVLHGSPMLAGVPAHLVLVLLGVGCVGGFGLMYVSPILGFAAVGGAVVAWVGLAFVFQQDRVAVPLFLLRRWYRFPGVISSYTRSYARVLVVEE